MIVNARFPEKLSTFIELQSVRNNMKFIIHNVIFDSEAIMNILYFFKLNYTCNLCTIRSILYTDDIKCL